VSASSRSTHQKNTKEKGVAVSEVTTVHSPQKKKREKKKARLAGSDKKRGGKRRCRLYRLSDQTPTKEWKRDNRPYPQKGGKENETICQEQEGEEKGGSYKTSVHQIPEGWGPSTVEKNHARCEAKSTERSPQRKGREDSVRADSARRRACDSI